MLGKQCETFTDYTECCLSHTTEPKPPRAVGPTTPFPSVNTSFRTHTGLFHLVSVCVCVLLWGYGSGTSLAFTFPLVYREFICINFRNVPKHNENKHNIKDQSWFLIPQIRDELEMFFFPSLLQLIVKLKLQTAKPLFLLVRAVHKVGTVGLFFA